MKKVIHRGRGGVEKINLGILTKKKIKNSLDLSILKNILSLQKLFKIT